MVTSDKIPAIMFVGTIVMFTALTAHADGRALNLEQELRAFKVPPAWIAAVTVDYDMSRPWKEARLEARRLMALNQEPARKQAVKLTWSYLKKGDIGDGHEYPQNLYLAGEKIWAVRALREFIVKPLDHTPIHSHLQLASLLVHFKDYSKAKATLYTAMSGLPGPPWRIARQADIHDAHGDLYAAWGKNELAKRHYREAIKLYPKSTQPYGRHLLKRRAGKVQSKLDLLTLGELGKSRLRDGIYTDRALGYVEDIVVAVKVSAGAIADIVLKHKEKIDQNACVLIPRRIIEKQSLHVDGITGATVTVDAIVNGTYRALKKAGLK